jgi:hypothetical protein
MMKRLFIYVLFVSLSGAYISCSKEMSYEIPGGGNDSTLAGDFRALINNVQWVASRSTESASIIGGLINITGTSTDNKQISITLNGTKPGQYLMDQHSVNFLSYVDGNSGNTNAFTTNQGTDTSLAGGTVTVTSIDTVHKTISGYFQCKVYRNMDSQQELITQGSFTEIPYVTTLPLAPLGDSFHVLIDGVEWVPPSITATTNLGELIVAGSERDASRVVALVMPLNVAPGLYQLNYLSGSFFGEYSPNPSTLLISDTGGTLFIVENNPISRRIRGNFQFQAKDLTGGTGAATLSEGYFSLVY